MSKVYHLKHSTHREQYRWMKERMEWNESLKEHQAREAENPTPAVICKVCGVNEVEKSPMRAGVCYDCYRASVDTLKHSTNDYTAALEYDATPADDARESDEIQAWLSSHMDEVPEIKF